MTDQRDEFDRWTDPIDNEGGPAPDPRFVRELRSGLMKQASHMRSTNTSRTARSKPAGRWLDRRTALQLAAVLALVFAWVGTLAGGGPRELTDRFGSFASQQDAAVSAPSMYRGNNARTGVVDDTGPAENPYVAWEVAPAEADFNVVNANESTILLSYGHERILVALDRSTGAERWRFGTSCSFLDMTPLVLDGVVYFSSACPDQNPGAITALDEATGAVRWQAEFASPVVTDPMMVNGTLFVMLDGHPPAVAAIDAEHGEQKWVSAIERLDKQIDVPTPEKYIGNVASFSPAYGDELIYSTSFDGVIHALDVDSGEVRWSYDTGGNAVSTPSFSDGVLYLSFAGITMADVDGGLLALDVRTGQPLWQADLPVHSPYASPVISADLVIMSLYNLPAERRTTAWDRNTGEQLWQINSGGTTTLADGTLYLFELGRGEVLAIDPATGDVNWQAFIAHFELLPGEASYIRGEPIIQDGALITGSQAERVLVIEAASTSQIVADSPDSTKNYDFTGLPACMPPSPTQWQALDDEPAHTLVPDDPQLIENESEGLSAAMRPESLPNGVALPEREYASLAASIEAMRACADRPSQVDVSGFFSEDFFRRTWVRVSLNQTPAPDLLLQSQLERAMADGRSTNFRVLADGRIAMEIALTDHFSNLVVFTQSDDRWVIDELIEITPNPEAKG